MLQSLAVDNTKLRDSEKKLIKEKIKLTRQCKVRKLNKILHLSLSLSFFPLSLHRCWKWQEIEQRIG